MDLSRKSKTLLIVANVDWFFISHRLGIGVAALNEGWKVYVACKNTGRKKEIESYGLVFVDLKFSRSGTNLFEEVLTIIKLYFLYRNLNPDVVHHITLKPVIYGSIISKFLRIKGVVNAISGLGFNFTNNRQTAVKSIIIFLMKFGFKRSNISIIFQNTDDKAELIKLGVVNSRNDIVVIKGSGVNLGDYSFSDYPSFTMIRILFPARMLWDKGLGELKIATEVLKNVFCGKIQFLLAGSLDPENKSAVPLSFLDDWVDGDYVQWLGHRQDMIDLYKNCHIVVLPSYREGIPKSLIEACSVGRAIVTTNAIGCKECVDDGINGILVPVKDAIGLAMAIEKLILNPELLISMGLASREIAEQNFDINRVVDDHLRIYNNLIR